MTTDEQSTPLGREQVEERIRAWFAAGLPEGKIYHSPTGRETVFVQVPDPAMVAVWAVALGQEIVVGGGVASAGELGRVRPVDLPGWVFNVWCCMPTVPAELRIEVSA